MIYTSLKYNLSFEKETQPGDYLTGFISELIGYRIEKNKKYPITQAQAEKLSVKLDGGLSGVEKSRLSRGGAGFLQF